jgi:hypothetical protein
VRHHHCTEHTGVFGTDFDYNNRAGPKASRRSRSDAVNDKLYSDRCNHCTFITTQITTFNRFYSFLNANAILATVVSMTFTARCSHVDVSSLRATAVYVKQ